MEMYKSCKGIYASYHLSLSLCIYIRAHMHTHTIVKCDVMTSAVIAAHLLYWVLVRAQIKANQEGCWWAHSRKPRRDLEKYQ